MPHASTTPTSDRRRPRPDPFSRLMNWLSSSHQDEQPPAGSGEGKDPLSRLMNRLSG